MLCFFLLSSLQVLSWGRHQVCHLHLHHLLHHPHQIEGVLYEETLEAESDLVYKFEWDKRNTYNQKVYGKVPVIVSVGYEYIGCSDVIHWDKLTTSLWAHDSGDVGGWSVSAYHVFNFNQDIIHRGDGTNHFLANSPLQHTTILNDVTQSSSSFPSSTSSSSSSPPSSSASSASEPQRLYGPMALAAGRDGSLYVGTWGFIKRVDSGKTDVANILQMSYSDPPYNYYITMSPVDGKLYISKQQELKILRIKTMGPVRDLSRNFEVIAGTGEQCYHGDLNRCGDSKSALKAKLSYPKGITINKDGVMFIADGTNIRTISNSGIIDTFIGFQDGPKLFRPIDCYRDVPLRRVTLHWPTSLAINPLDDS
ncbi:hypothetical protein HELRODRAFT_81516, partial [Helobdella robusta]|uniref:Uncharacterized protein n=1 Tax=Helobdella robusta TaxID=6412 RepID=T1G4F2_HELRO